MEETYSERINLVFGKGIDVVATHAKHGDLDTKREIYIKIKRKKKTAKYISYILDHWYPLNSAWVK